MKQLIFTILLSGFTMAASAQVGIGTTTPPQKMLTVRGSVLLDEGNNSNGSLDSTALLFGTMGDVGITSPKNSPVARENGGLKLYTNDTSRITIHNNGNIRIADTATVNTAVRLAVGGNSQFKGNVAIGGTGNFQPGVALSVNDDAVLTDECTIFGYVGIGGYMANPSGLYKLLVYGSTRTDGDLRVNGDADFDGSITAGVDVSAGDDLVADDDVLVGDDVIATGSLIANANLTIAGNATIGGNANVTGTSNVTGNATVGGGLTVTGEILVDANNGIVKSNTTDQFRLAFNSGGFSFALVPGAYVDIPFAIANFTGNNDDVRVTINQFIPASGSGNTWQQCTMTIFDTDATANSCTIRFYNAGTTTSTMNGTLYLTTIFTD